MVQYELFPRMYYNSAASSLQNSNAPSQTLENDRLGHDSAVVGTRPGKEY